jgi:hypothetical protein
MKIMFLHEEAGRGRRLGRHVRHDPRSWSFPAAMASQLRSVRHKRSVPIFDQGQLGSCTGNAGVGCVSTAPFTHHGTEQEAVDVYSSATHYDGIQGVYPPTDTGSSGLAVMKILKKRGWVKGYSHAFSFDAVLRALVLRPGITGIAWRGDCDSPGPDGLVRYTGEIVGGHEIVLAGLDVERKLVILDNSWGSSWGYKGSFAMSFSDYEKALADHGDATFPEGA